MLFVVSLRIHKEKKPDMAESSDHEEFIHEFESILARGEEQRLADLNRFAWNQSAHADTLVKDDEVETEQEIGSIALSREYMKCSDVSNKAVLNRAQYFEKIFLRQDEVEVEGAKPGKKQRWKRLHGDRRLKIVRKIFEEFHLQGIAEKLLTCYSELLRCSRARDSWMQVRDESVCLRRKSFIRFLCIMEDHVFKVQQLEKIYSPWFPADVTRTVMLYISGDVFKFVSSIEESIYTYLQFHCFRNGLGSVSLLTKDLSERNFIAFNRKIGTLLCIPDFQVLSSVVLLFEHPELSRFLNNWWCHIEGIRFHLPQSRCDFCSFRDCLDSISHEQIPHWVSVDPLYGFNFLKNIMQLCSSTLDLAKTSRSRRRCTFRISASFDRYSPSIINPRDNQNKK